ncbi:MULTISPECIES: galactose-1-epimerase [unclassified Vibrio]|uniref:Aldose 1-epimerase n=1 Tax=Vibrio sp. HB236076 TaxID=3232307 RepID=A0AB39HFI6_9VIBR|nr:galactose-1-epimerase [Vibrio sp. HB161653]MDP5253123.1 galactose-1-epimerase [Vibrio sp. HB161653]
MFDVEGSDITIVTLSNRRGMRVQLMDLGATWLSCVLPVSDDEPREVLLGVDNLSDFERQSCYMGSTIGRYANRIAHGRYRDQDGAEVSLSTNHQTHCLHGGAQGFDRRRWDIVGKSSNSVRFALHSADGDQGFPGQLTVHLEYVLNDNDQLMVHYQAQTTKPCPVSLTNHAYFNLNGEGSQHSGAEQWLSVNADYFFAVDEHGIPEPRPKPVAGTAFELHTPRYLADSLLLDPQQQGTKGYDHSVIRRAEDGQPLPLCATLASRDKKVVLTLTTSQPAMQIYTGNWLSGQPARHQRTYQDYHGVAIEPQLLPNAPNNPQWCQSPWHQPEPLLYPGQVYQQWIGYHFSF